MEKVQRLHAFLRTHVPLETATVSFAGAITPEAIKKFNAADVEPESDDEIRQATSGIHGYGDGLYLRVKPSGAKSWVLRVQKDGKREDVGLGGYPIVGLREAREKALSLRRAAKYGAGARAERDRKSNERATKIERLGYSIAEAAHMLGISERFVYRLIDADTLPKIKIGRRVLIPAPALLRLIGER